MTQMVVKAAVAGHQLPQNPAATWEEVIELSLSIFVLNSLCPRVVFLIPEPQQDFEYEVTVYKWLR